MHRLGIYCFGDGFDYPLPLPLIKQVGFDCIFTGDFAKGADARACAVQTAEECARLGLRYESIHAPFDGINEMWRDGEKGDNMLCRLKNSIDICAMLGIPYTIVHLSSGENAPCVNDIGHARYDKLVEHAVNKGVTIAFENQRKLANLAFVMELYKDVKEVRFCWDVGHEACFTDGREFMPIFGDKLAYTHIHDNCCIHNGDDHMIPFDGAIDFTRVASHLKRYAGEDVTLTLELRYHGTEPEDAYIARAYAAAAKLRTMVEA